MMAQGKPRAPAASPRVGVPVTGGSHLGGSERGHGVPRGRHQDSALPWGGAMKSLLVRVMVYGTSMTSLATSRAVAVLQEFKGWVAFWKRWGWARVSRGCPEPRGAEGSISTGRGWQHTDAEVVKPHHPPWPHGSSPSSLGEGSASPLLHRCSLPSRPQHRGSPCSAPTLSPSPCPIPPRTLTSLSVPDSRHRATTAQSGICRQVRTPMQTPRLVPQAGNS